MLGRTRRDELAPLGCLPFATTYLQKIQRADVPEVNEALNAVYITSGNFGRLKQYVA